MIIQDKKSILYPGHLALICPYEEHSYKSLTEEWHVNIVGFSGTTCDALMKNLKMNMSGIYHFNNPDIFKLYLSDILDIQVQMSSKSEIKNKEKGRYLIDLSKICYDLLLDMSLATTYIDSEVKSTDNEVIKTIVSYIEDHYREQISLDDLASEVNLSRSYICDLFKKEMEQTVIQYLTKFRISRSRILLDENPDLKVFEIGRLCGFENPSYFGETFKKIVGMTPIEYRLK